ncbi:MAG: Hsp20/alpha crystallin family protein [Candidatus Rifleibacteriota bacterium]
MNWKKLAPWNWFKKEEEEAKIPVSKDSDVVQHAGNQMVEFQNQVNNLFNAFLKAFSPQFSKSFLTNEGIWNGFLKPTLDIAADEKNYTTTVELPGVDPSEVKIELRQNNLYITGEKKQEQEFKDREHYRLERSYGMFRRVLTLPEDADLEKIEASFKNGVLTVKIPRIALPESECRNIEVKTG